MPVNISPLSDEIIARGVQAPDYSKGFDNFFLGQQQAQQQAEQNLFAKGLPRVPGTNDIDWAAAGEQIARLQGIKGLQTAVSLQTEADLQRALGRLGTSSIFQSGQSGQTQRPQLPPSSQRSTLQTAPTADSGMDSGGVPARPGQNLVQPNEVPGSARMSVDGGPETPIQSTLTARTLAPRVGKDPDALAVEWGVGVDQPLDPAEVRSKVAASPSFADRFSGGGTASAATAGVTPTPIPTVPVRPGVPQITIPAQRQAQAQAAPTAPAAPPTTQPPPLSDPVADEWERRATEAAAAGTAISMKNPAMGARLQAMSDQLFKQAHDRRQTLGGVYKSQQEGVYKQEQVLPEAAAKASVSKLEKSQEKADAVAAGANSTQELFDQLNSKSGIFTGAWSDSKLNMARIAQTLGYPIAPEQITSTQTFMALMGKQVAAGVKAFGSGTSITNQDREYVQKAVGGDISLDETSIRRIIDITDKLNRGVIQKHNDDVDRVIKSNPAARATLEPFKVDMPPPIKGRISQAVQPPAGTIQPPPANPAARIIGQIYPTAKGNAYWRGTGWELVK